MRRPTTSGRTVGPAPRRRLTRWRTERVGLSGSAVEQGYVEWLQRESMLARGGAVASQLAGLGSMSQRPVRALRSPGRDREGVRVVHGVPDLDDHQAR